MWSSVWPCTLCCIVMCVVISHSPHLDLQQTMFCCHLSIYVTYSPLVCFLMLFQSILCFMLPSVCVCMWSNFNQALLTGVYYPNLDSRRGALVAVVTLSINITMTTGHRKQSCYRRAHVQCSIKGCCCCMHDRSARDNNCYIVRRARRERNLIGQCKSAATADSKTY